MWRQKKKSTIQQINQQKFSMDVNLRWTTSQMMQHFYSMFRRTYHLVSSSVAVVSTEDHKKTLRERTRNKSSNKLCFKGKAF